MLWYNTEMALLPFSWLLFFFFCTEDFWLSLLILAQGVSRRPFPNADTLGMQPNLWKHKKWAVGGEIEKAKCLSKGKKLTPNITVCFKQNQSAQPFERIVFSPHFIIDCGGTSIKNLQKTTAHWKALSRLLWNLPLLFTPPHWTIWLVTQFDVQWCTYIHTHLAHRCWILFVKSSWALDKLLNHPLSPCLCQCWMAWIRQRWDAGWWVFIVRFLLLFTVKEILVGRCFLLI